MNNIPYDSTEDTIKHIQRVKFFLDAFSWKLTLRGLNHDQSKLQSPEKEIFDEWTPKLSSVQYGTSEFEEMKLQIKPALDHHYANNSHHPEFYSNGIDGMDLLDLVEMFCDWKAATERTKDGDINKSIEYNAKRFNISPQLVSIFQNTVTRFLEDEQHSTPTVKQG